jgi:hypothetical protein
MSPPRRIGKEPDVNHEIATRRPTTRGAVVATLIAGSALTLTTVAAVEAGGQAHPEKICLGQDPDDECQVGPPTGTTEATAALGEHASTHDDVDADLAAANRAAAIFQDVEQAEAVGYVNTIDTLGCFEDPQRGGMGLHYVNESLVDTTVDATAPEALVYELDAEGQITELVAHEYIVPIEAWTDAGPPRLFGREFHQHSSLPLWILHTWIWKDNPMGVFEDFNPRIRPCPEGVPVFGTDADCFEPHRSPTAADVARCS